MSTLYAADHDEFLPPIFTFQAKPGEKARLLELLDGYKGGEATFCPADHSDLRASEIAQVEGTGRLGYAHDQGLASLFIGKGPVPLINLSKVGDPSETLFFRDPIRSIQSSGEGVTMHSPHGEFFVGSYLDGHARSSLKFETGKFVDPPR